MLAIKLEANYDTAFTIRFSSCVGEDRRKGRRKRKEKGERKIEKDK